MTSVERVKYICKDRKIAISRLEKDLGFSNGYIGQLRKGVLPDDRLKLIADYLNVSVEYLMTGTEEESDEEGKTIHSISKTDPDIKKHIDLIMESLEGKDKIVYDGAEVKLTEYNKKLLRRAMETVYDVVENEKGKEQK